MNTETLYISSVFLAGILSFFSPCVIPLLPVYFSVFAQAGLEENNTKTKAQLRVALLLRTLLFVAGIACCFIVLGFGAGALGSVINSNIFLILMGAVVVVMGIHQTGLIHIKALYKEKKVRLERAKKKDGLGVFLLGLTFSFGWTPCIGPILAAILGLASGRGTALYGGFLMTLYSLGFAIPFMVLALFSELLLGKMKGIYKHLGKIKVASGVVIILMGILLMTGSLTQLSAWAGSIAPPM